MQKKAILILYALLVSLLLMSCSDMKSEYIDSLFFNNDETKLDDETVTDFDGNVYHTITIGDQTWMVENLRSTHYADGSAVKESFAVNGSEGYSETFGRLYTFQSAMRYDSIEGAQGICPEGWHIPTRAEIQSLIDFVKSNNKYVLFTDQLCSSTGWTTKNGRNTLLFNAVPNGVKIDGQYKYFGEISSFWTSNLHLKHGIMYYMSTDSTKYKSSFYYSNNLSDGIGVRCIKNSSSIKLPTVVIDSVSKGIKKPKVYGHIVNANGGTVSKVGVCYALTANVGLSDNVILTTYIQNRFVCELNDLTTNSKYYIRVFAQNELGTGYSAEQTYQTTAFAPVISALNMTAITANSAIFTANVTDDCGSSVTAKGICWSLTPNPTVSLNTKTSNGIGLGVFSATATGLSANTSYYLRAYATNAIGTSYNEQVLFITLPTVTIGSATSITYKSASVSATIPTQGSNPITEYGICWGTSTSPTITSNKLTATNLSNTNYSCALSNLSSATKYYARAFITNSTGTNYSNEISFTTAEPVAPVVSSTSVNNITYKSATLTGTLTTTGDLPINEYGFCLSNTSTTPTISNTIVGVTNLNSQTGMFSTALSTLSANTTYYVRTYAITNGGTYYGSVSNFITPADPFTVSDGLLAFYNFDAQNCKDALGNYNGVISGGVTFSSSTPKSTGYSAQFDGTTGFINIPYQIIPSSGSWSMTMWVKTNLKSCVLFSTSYNSFQLSNSKFVLNNDFYYWSYSYNVDLISSFLNNSWHLFTLTSNGNSYKYYIDGILFETLTLSSFLLSNDITLIGKGFYDNAAYKPKFSGSLDNIRFYNRLLSTTEISTLYNTKQ